MSEKVIPLQYKGNAIGTAVVVLHKDGFVEIRAFSIAHHDLPKEVFEYATQINIE